MRVLVAGAGVSGLATALALCKAGHDVEIVERAPELTEVGAGITLQPHGMRCLDHLGVTPRLRYVSLPGKISFKDMLKGGQLFETTLGNTAVERYGAPLAAVHRRDLIDALASGLPRECLRLGSEITGAEQDERSVRVRLKNGAVLEGDLLIGADGLGSTVRTVFFGEVPRVFTGYLAWRTVLPASQVDVDLSDQISIWLGAGRHVISYLIRDNQQVYTGCYVPADEVHREDWGVSGDVDDLHASFADACPELRRLIAAIDRAFITGVFYRERLESWHKGRVLLVGDAAHPVLPTSGSGAALGLEDAVALAACLDRHGTDYERAFAEFEARRKPRTSRVLAVSRADLRAFQESDAERRRIRLRIDAGMHRVDPIGQKRVFWLYGYDEVSESARPLEEFMADHGNPLRRAEARRAFDMWRSAVQPEDIAGGWDKERDAFTRFMRAVATMPPEMQVDEVEIDGVRALRVVPPRCAEGPALVHFEGNGYAFGPSQASAVLAARIAQKVGGWALVPHVRPVPEFSAGDQISDAIRAYAWASARANAIFLSGECSGGGLALRLAMALRDSNASRPAALYLVSPFLDMTLSSRSVAENATRDAWMDLRRLLFFAAAHTQGDDPGAARFSPLQGDLSRLPPALVFAAANEALADDARALVEGMRAAGCEARLTLVDDTVHSFALFDFLPETDAFLEAVAEDAAARIGAIGAKPGASELLSTSGS